MPAAAHGASSAQPNQNVVHGLGRILQLYFIIEHVERVAACMNTSTFEQHFKLVIFRSSIFTKAFRHSLLQPCYDEDERGRRRRRQ